MRVLLASQNRGDIFKKNPEILVGNSRSLRTVSVVYLLPKISVLPPSARLDASYNMKLVRTQETCKW